MVSAVLGIAGDMSAQNLPAPPQATVDTTWPAQSGITHTVLAGGDFQGALDQALLGDTILLQAGATFSGTFTLRPKSGTGWIIVRTSAPDSSLPPLGQRITPAYASVLPKIVAGNGPAVQTAAGAHHYRFVGVEITLNSSITQNYGLIYLGDGSGAQSSLSQVPHSLVFDRVYAHGNATANLRRGFALNSANTAIINSYISDVHETGADSQAIGGWNGPGPFKIANNYLEAAGENVMFGGADPRIPNLVPSDIEVRGNHFYKQLSWKIGHPSYAGRAWSVKNIFELKNARRVLVDGNVFEHNWPHAQNGFSILFTVRNQDGTAPWSVVEDVTFTNNIIRHVASGVNILGRDDINTSQPAVRILVRNNLFYDLGGSWGGGRLFQLLVGTTDVTIDHNTGIHTGEVVNATAPAHTRFVYRNNLSPNNQYGVAGDGTFGNPNLTLSTYFPGAVFLRNVLAGGSASSYPANNFFPSALADVRFVNMSSGNYRLQSISPYVNAGTDGKDVGADFDALEAATAGAVSGGSTPVPPPVPDTTPPSVSISAPVAGAIVSTTISLTASASDNVGVAGVQFLLDGSPLGAEDFITPYSVSWNATTATNGLHTITATARDAAGNRTTSLPIGVTVSITLPDVTPPTVSISAPLNGNTVTGTTPVSATAADNVGVVGVQYNIDGSPVGGEDMTAPYGWSWNTATATNGSHTITATARDAAGNRTTSTGVVVAVNNIPPDTTAPVIAISDPLSGASVSGVSVVSATATDSVGVVGVQFFLDGSLLGAEDTAAPHDVSWNTTTASNGAHTLTAIARDAAGNQGAAAPVNVTVANDVPPPPPPSQSPFKSIQVPGQFEAEDFDRGGEGVAYHDLTAGNAGGAYRIDESVDIGSSVAGQAVVNSFQTGEWLEYTIDVLQSGTFSIEALVSSEYTTSGFHVEVDGADVTGPINVPHTGRWSIFQWVGIGGLSLTAGSHVLRIHADAEYFNVDALRISSIASSQSPFKSVQVPGQFEAEDFDRGGEGVAYHDLTAGNAGGQYRVDDSVDIVTPVAGKVVVNYFQTGEWLEYTLNVPQAGTYDIEALVSTEYTTSAFHVEVDGVDVTGSINVPSTGRWSTFQWVGKAGVNLAAGQRVVRVHADAEYFNLDAIRITGVAQPPYTTIADMPGRIEAEDFDRGGEGVAYHDLSTGNAGALYRIDESVDIVSTATGQMVVNYFQTGEWLEYTINVPQAGTYTVEALLSSEYTTSAFHIEVDCVDVTGVVAVPSTGRWATFQWVGKAGVNLNAGQHVLRIHADAEYFNLDAIRIR